MYKIELNLPIIGKIFINIQNKQLFIFTKRQLKNYIIDVSINNDNTDFVTIYTNIDEKFNDVVLGREIKFQHNILQFLKTTRVQTIDYKYDFNNQLILDIKFKKNFFYYIKAFLSSNYAMNHILFYQSILYPIFSLYTLVDNYFLVHGSLLKLGDKYIVLTGLDGVGKSSLSNELVVCGAKILADNFVLFNGDSFLGLNMPIRLDLENSTNENTIYKDSNLKEILYDYKKDTEINVDEVYFLNISDNLEVKIIDKNIAKHNWNFINNGAGEIIEANSFCLPFLYQNLISLKQDIDGNIKYFSFSIPKGKIKEAVKEILWD